ncbi:Nn.00g059080.m01.CDS01 [Neocucurbitaria sp. VM-36]
MLRHFYTTDPSGELAPDVGYQLDGRWVDGARLDGTLGYYVFSEAQGLTVPVYRFLHPDGDHFYTTERNGIAEQVGYTFERIGWHMPVEQGPDNTGYYRFYNPDTNDHLLTTDPFGEVLGYRNDGLLGYIYNYPKPGSIQLQGFVNRGYTLDGNTLKSTVYARSEGQNKASRVDLTYCIANTSDCHIYVANVPTDEELQSPNTNFRLDTLLKDPLTSSGLALKDPAIVHQRYVRPKFEMPGAFADGIEQKMEKLSGENVTDSECDIAPYLRHRADGMLEFVHSNPNPSPSWLTNAWQYVSQDGSASDPLGRAKSFAYYYNNHMEMELLWRDFLRGTYVENGNLVRHGTWC